jgi:PGAP1-like protein
MRKKNMEVRHDRTTHAESFFDNAIHAPSGLKLLMESRSIIELGSFFKSLPGLRTAPKGDGHPVLVIPGFLANDPIMMPLRWTLKNLGYKSEPWAYGTNRVFCPEISCALEKRIVDLHQKTGKKVSIIGWSLGGIYARHISQHIPEHVRSVITLGTPFSRHMRSGFAVKLYELWNDKIHTVPLSVIEKIRKPLPVPYTSIYSKTDCIVAWQCSVCDFSDHKEVDHVEIRGSHLGLGFNPGALWVIADRLSQPEESWSPFCTSGIHHIQNNLRKGSFSNKVLHQNSLKLIREFIVSHRLHEEIASL